MSKNLDNRAGILIIAAFLCAWGLSTLTFGIGPHAMAANGFHEISGAAGEGSTDHGALTGLTDDDHPQYYMRSEQATFGNISGTDMQLDGNLTLTGAVPSVTLTGTLPCLTLNTNGFFSDDALLDFSHYGVMRNRIRSSVSGAVQSFTLEDASKTYITLGGLNGKITLGATVDAAGNPITNIPSLCIGTDEHSTPGNSLLDIKGSVDDQLAMTLWNYNEGGSSSAVLRLNCDFMGGDGYYAGLAVGDESCPADAYKNRGVFYCNSSLDGASFVTGNPAGDFRFYVNSVTDADAAMTLDAQSTLTAGKFSLKENNTAPSSASDTGVEGEIRFTGSYVFYCYSTNAWKRAAMSAW